MVIHDGKIKNYQAVVPSTWNAGPRDEKDQPGPYEASLVGNPVADPEQPLEVLRTIHSFDPCLACAIHTMDPEGKEIARVKVLLMADDIRVIGLGNVLMGDDGFGHTLSTSSTGAYEFPPNVALIDAGTPGLDLTPFLMHATKLIVVDTVRSDGPPGSIRLYRRDDILRRPRPAGSARSRPEGNAVGAGVQRHGTGGGAAGGHHSRTHDPDPRAVAQVRAPWKVRPSKCFSNSHALAWLSGLALDASATTPWWEEPAATNLRHPSA